MEALLTLFGLLGLLTFALVYSTMAWGYVTYKFWAWFILPVFTGLPHLTYWQAIGIACFIELFKNHKGFEVKKEYREDSSSTYASAICAPWIVLLVGYIAYAIAY